MFLVYVLAVALGLQSQNLRTEKGSDPFLRQEFIKALPYPDGGEGDVPLNGVVESIWVIRRPASADPLAPIEVVRNPKNPATDAQRLHDERELEDAMEAMKVELRQGAPEANEQVAFLRARAASVNRLTIEFARPASLTYSIDSSVQPEITRVPGVDAFIVAVRGNAYRVEEIAGGRQQVRWREAEARVFVGAAAPPAITRRPGYDTFTVSFVDAPPRVLVATLRGNEDMITRVIDHIDWARVRELAR